MVNRWNKLKYNNPIEFNNIFYRHNFNEENIDKEINIFVIDF